MYWLLSLPVLLGICADPRPRYLSQSIPQADCFRIVPLPCPMGRRRWRRSHRRGQACPQCRNLFRRRVRWSRRHLPNRHRVEGLHHFCSRYRLFGGTIPLDFRNCSHMSTNRCFVMQNKNNLSRLIYKNLGHIHIAMGQNRNLFDHRH